MSQPVVPGDRVVRVLERDLALVAVFERHSPHFAKLRNPMLRRTMARLVTVEQAAGIAGIPVEALVRDLNDALGIAADASPPSPSPTSSTATVVTTAERPRLREALLDVREELRQGGEPFSLIMAAIASLDADEMLCLRAPFEPVPLYAVLARRGFVHATERLGEDDWVVWFWRGAGGAEPAADARAGVLPSAAPGETWLDVRGLEPPEPMLRTLDALGHLPDGGTLVQVNVRVPQFLLPMLTERGFEYRVDDGDPERVLLRIRKQ